MVMTLAGMRSLLEANPEQRFEVLAQVNLHKSPDAESLVTQAATGRRFVVEQLPLGSEPGDKALYVRLSEDDYPGWLLASDLDKVAVTKAAAIDVAIADSEIDDRSKVEARLPKILAFVRAALMTPNEYLWGGTVSPHYDCSGLMQAAFWSEGIWLPRDAYQQEAFLHALPVSSAALATGDYSGLVAGDLVFFGNPERATHVGLYVGDGCYIHSSGKDMGRNGIAVDRLTFDAEAPAVSRKYFETFRGAGRVVKSYRGGQEFSAKKE